MKHERAFSGYCHNRFCLTSLEHEKEDYCFEISFKIIEIPFTIVPSPCSPESSNLDNKLRYNQENTDLMHPDCFSSGFVQPLAQKD